MNKFIIAAAMLAVSTAAVAQQELLFQTEPTVNGDNPRTRTSEGGSSYYFEIPDTPRVAQVVQQPAPVYVAPAPAPIVAAAPPQAAPAPVVVAPVTPEPVRARKVDRN